MKNLFLKARIIERFGTQSDSARLVGISKDRLSKLIHGRLCLREAEKEMISKKLGVPECEIFPAS